MRSPIDLLNLGDGKSPTQYVYHYQPGTNTKLPDRDLELRGNQPKQV